MRPRRLRVRTQLERRRAGDSVFRFGDIVLHGHRQLTPYTLSTRRPELSPGFSHPALDMESTLAMVEALVSADLHVLVDPRLTVREGHDIASAVKQRLLEQGPNVIDVLVQIEPFDD